MILAQYEGRDSFLEENSVEKNIRAKVEAMLTPPAAPKKTAAKKAPVEEIQLRPLKLAVGPLTRATPKRTLICMVLSPFFTRSALLPRFLVVCGPCGRREASRGQENRRR